MNSPQNKLLAIKQFGQKIWLDNLSRELLNSGELMDMVNKDGIAGVTSNPTIFHKAIQNDKQYAKDLIAVKGQPIDYEMRFENLVIPDIQQACDLLKTLYQESHQNDGYVSFEVSPNLANDAALTIENAKRLWKTINRPNLMIKVPGTKAGIEALEALTRDGINVNITLLFSLKQVNNTWAAYIRGLNYRKEHNLPLNNIKAVASFFLSRIDSAIDHKLPPELQGKAAIALAKCAYLKYQEIFEGNEFSPLKKLGAKGQYLLWASTGTKNPNYSDVLYVESLIGRDTINTVPDATLAAFRDHGVARDSLPENLNNSPETLKQVEKYVDMEELGESLQVDGLKSFSNSFIGLLELVK